MAGKVFTLQIYTQASKVFEADDVNMVSFPAEDGSMGVLANHAPMIAVLGKGSVAIRQASQPDDEPRTFAIEGGFLEVASNRATILTDRFDDTNRA